ncbi:hypothetical protein EV126DRAFT_239767 [Verticillium dahliae]|nr:hypothetical protein EV126DRAFT_239767 [Verticillium dahliae]
MTSCLIVQTCILLLLQCSFLLGLAESFDRTNHHFFDRPTVYAWPCFRYPRDRTPLKASCSRLHLLFLDQRVAKVEADGPSNLHLAASFLDQLHWPLNGQMGGLLPMPKFRTIYTRHRYWPRGGADWQRPRFRS